MRTALLLVAALAVSDSVTAPAGFLRATAVRVTPGQTLEVTLPEMQPDDVDWMFFRAAGHQENRDTATPNERGAVPFLAPHADTCMIGLDRKPRVQEVSARALESWFRAALGEPPRGFEVADPDAAVRVRRVESSKLLVRIGAEGADDVPSATPQSKSGQMTEIRPLADPTTVPLGSVLPMRIYAPGAPEEAVAQRVIARHPATGRVVSSEVREGGIAQFEVSESGTWLVEAHTVTKPEGRAEVAWSLFTATLTFEAAESMEFGEDDR